LLLSHRLSKLLSDLIDGNRILIFLQTKKNYVLAEFKSDKSPMTAATYVAARGLGMMIYLKI
jgi:ATP-dependent RNA helicase DDX5/DBP2